MRRMAFWLLAGMFLLFLPRLASAGDGSLLFARIASGDIEGVRAAVAAGENVNARNRKGDTPLLHALSLVNENGYRDGFYRDVAVRGNDFASGSPSGECENCDMVSLLLSLGANVNAKGNDGATALHRAAGIGPQTVKILLAASADVNAVDAGGATPLFAAALLVPGRDPAAKLACVRLLLAAGADVNARNRQGQTPLTFVGILAQGKFPEASTLLAKMLIEAGADVNARDGQGGSPLLNWVAGSPDAVKMLIEAGADVNVQDNLGMTPLLAVTIFNGTPYSDRILRLLTDAGADPNVKANDGTSALWIAALRGRTKDVAALLAAGASVDMGMEGMTPLHAATGIIGMETRDNRGTFEERVRHGLEMFRSRLQPEPEIDFLGVTKLLVEAGANVDTKSVRASFYGPPGDPAQASVLKRYIGKTPLDFARMLGNTEVAKYLQSVGAKTAGRWYWPF